MSLTLALMVSGAFALDRLLGEPKRFHPLSGFGRLAQGMERHLHRGGRAGGAVAVIALLAPLVALATALATLPGIAPAMEVALLYLAIGLHSLGAHASPVTDALQQGELAGARQAVGRIVSRDTGVMNTEDVACAAVESVLENGNDAVFGALFWFLLLGAPGAVLYRLSNTLDAMWGYRNDRYRHFGWAAARFDDLLNYLPARLTALTYALLGNTRQALACWRAQAPAWDSPNAGPVMAAGAGALGVTLGGRARYAGEWHERPPLGAGPSPTVDHIEGALRLVRRGVVLWLVAFLAVDLLHG